MWQRAAEGDRHRLGAGDVDAVERLQVHVRLGAVARVAALGDHVPEPHGLPTRTRLAGLLRTSQAPTNG
ncbi:hypothetical protein ACPCG0_06685 [Propionibacteriaceae bacterium Y1923]